jgi:hypothetical protein
VHVSRRVMHRGVLAFVTISALTASTVVAGAATTTTTTAAKGSATSSVTVLELSLLGNTLTAGKIAAVADNSVSPHNVKLVVTPVDSSVTGPVGQQTVTPGSAATQVPSTPQSASLPNGVGSITGPTFSVSAADDAAGVLTNAALKALGTVNILTVPLNLQTASLTNAAQVTKSGATAEKVFDLGTLSLPSLQDLLASLGLDLNKLFDLLTQANLDSLASLVTSTTSGAVKTASDAVDTAQAAIGANAPASLSGAQSALTTATGAVTAAQGAVTTANTAFSSAMTQIPALSLVPLGVSSGLTPAQFQALPAATQTSVDALTSQNLAALATSAVSAQTALTAAQALVTQLNALITALTDLVNGVLAAVKGSTDPLASLGGVHVVTKAVAASTPTADADVTVASTHVLGTLASLPISQLSGALAPVTSTLTNVLDSVAGVKFTPPTIAIGTPSKSTSTSGLTRKANASVDAVTVNLPSLTLPAALTLPGVPTAVSGKLVVGQLAEAATFVLGTSTTRTTTPTTTPSTAKTGKLASTGGSMKLPALAALLMLTSLAILQRRRSVRAGAEDAGA